MKQIEFKPIPTALLVPGQIVSDISSIDDAVLLEFVKVTEDAAIFNYVGGDSIYLRSEDGTISFNLGGSDFYEVPQELINKLKHK
jgi:hypothetical protein